MGKKKVPQQTNERVHIYVVKWVFTLGILRAEAEFLDDTRRKFWYDVSELPEEAAKYNHTTIRFSEAFENLNDAIARAEQMRIKRIEKLKKQLAELEAMEF